MKEYLGDSVYAEINRVGDIVLTTENGLPHDPSNIIVLDAEILGNLIKFAANEVRRGAC